VTELSLSCFLNVQKAPLFLYIHIKNPSDEDLKHEEFIVYPRLLGQSFLALFMWFDWVRFWTVIGHRLCCLIFIMYIVQPASQIEMSSYQVLSACKR